jgi:hypothetical protein
MLARCFRPFLLICLGSPLLAQDPRAEATAAAIARAKAALAPLASLVGAWDGDARAMMGPGRTLRVRQSEDITWGASETVIIIKGTGRGVEGPTTGQVVFEAAGIIWFDAQAGRVRMMTHRDGQAVEPTLELRPDTLIWGFPVPGGRVRYTIAFGNDAWHEVGEFLRDGAPPVVTTELTLRRVPR